LPPRVAPVRHLALSERAHDYGAWGKGIARKDLERIFAEYSDFEGVRSLRVKLYGIASKQSSDVDQLWEGLAENEEEDDE
jgi:hypothetical protein